MVFLPLIDFLRGIDAEIETVESRSLFARYRPYSPRSRSACVGGLAVWPDMSCEEEKIKRITNRERRWRIQVSYYFGENGAKAQRKCLYGRFG